MEDGRLVCLLVENRGARAEEVPNPRGTAAGQLDGVKFDDGSSGLVLRYAYSPRKRGTVEVIELSFLAENGSRDTHIYETKHGLRSLRRTDPP